MDWPTSATSPSLSSSQLVFNLGGLTQGSQYGFLNVNGTATLGGQLVLSFVNGFQTSVTNSDTFTLLISSSAFVGAFTNIASGRRLTTSGGFGTFLVTYTGSNLVLTDLPRRDPLRRLAGRERQLERLELGPRVGSSGQWPARPVQSL